MWPCIASLFCWFVTSCQRIYAIMNCFVTTCRQSSRAHVWSWRLHITHIYNHIPHTWFGKVYLCKFILLAIISFSLPTLYLHKQQYLIFASLMHPPYIIRRCHQCCQHHCHCCCNVYSLSVKCMMPVTSYVAHIMMWISHVCTSNILQIWHICAIS